MKKPSAALIGAFVIGAFVLAAAGIVILGAGRLLARHPTYVMFFEGSVKGLSPGSPVVFKGVKVGKVDRIGLQYDPPTRRVRIVVVSDIDLKSISRPQGEEATPAFFAGLIRQGLMAQLQFQNYVTGQLLVDLDFYPGRPVAIERAPQAYPVIPTTPSSLEKLSKGVENVPIDQVVARLATAVDSLARLASSPELRQAVSSLGASVEELRLVSRTLRVSLGPLMGDARSTMAETRTALLKLDGRSEELKRRADEVMEASLSALERADGILASLDHAGPGGQNLLVQVSESLEKASDAADSFKALADYLNRHPEALIRGKRAGD